MRAVDDVTVLVTRSIVARQCYRLAAGGRYRIPQEKSDLSCRFWRM